MTISSVINGVYWQGGLSPDAIHLFVTLIWFAKHWMSYLNGANSSRADIMNDSNFLDLSTRNLLKILNEIEQLLQRDYSAETLEATPLLGCTLFHNEGHYERGIADAALGRLGGTASHFTWPESYTLSTREQLDEAEVVASAADVLLSAQVSKDSFGNGRALTERMAKQSQADFISLHDDVYAHQSAMAVLSAFRSALGDLQGKNIAISWAFGSRFVLPSSAHSLFSLAAKFGSNVRIVAPSKFSLLRRVYRDAKNIAKAKPTEITEVEDFEDAFIDADAVFALNWGSFDNFNHPERNSSDAQGFEDWYFTRETIGHDGLFMTQPPVRREMAATPDLLSSPRNLTGEWLARRIATLVSTIRFVREQNDTQYPTALL